MVVTESNAPCLVTAIAEAFDARSSPSSELQRDDFIEKLDKAHVDYDVREDKASVFGEKVAYIFSIKATDLKKVV